jgi:hypothetical protein
MKPKSMAAILCLVFTATPLSAATLYNLQLNGSGTAHSGAARIGTAGDLWNNPAWVGVPTGSTTLFSGASLLTTAGVNNGVTATLTTLQNTNTSAWNDGGIFNRYSSQTTGSATVGLMDSVVKVDYANSTIDVLTLAVTGLPSDTAVTVYAYGSGTTTGTGTTWSLAAANGSASDITKYDGSATGRDITLASSEGLSWVSMSGTTDESGNLTLTATGPGSGIWWQVYTNGVQIEIVPEPGAATMAGIALLSLLARRRRSE